MDSYSAEDDLDLDFYNNNLSPGNGNMMFEDEENNQGVIENSCQYSHINYDHYESAHEVILDDFEQTDCFGSN